MSFDSKKPTVQLLGRWQPWHEGHTELFKRAIKKTGQVVIMARDMPWSEEDNPYYYELCFNTIKDSLTKEGYQYAVDYIIKKEPNIVNITYGRDVGYAIEQESFNEKTEKISGKSIRAEIRSNS